MEMVLCSQKTSLAAHQPSLRSFWQRTRHKLAIGATVFTLAVTSACSTLNEPTVQPSSIPPTPVASLAVDPGKLELMAKERAPFDSSFLSDHTVKIPKPVPPCPYDIGTPIVTAATTITPSMIEELTSIWTSREVQTDVPQVVKDIASAVYFQAFGHAIPGGLSVKGLSEEDYVKQFGDGSHAMFYSICGTMYVRPAVLDVSYLFYLFHEMGHGYDVFEGGVPLDQMREGTSHLMAWYLTGILERMLPAAPAVSLDTYFVTKFHLPIELDMMSFLSDDQWIASCNFPPGGGKKYNFYPFATNTPFFGLVEDSWSLWKSLVAGAELPHSAKSYLAFMRILSEEGDFLKAFDRITSMHYTKIDELGAEKISKAKMYLIVDGVLAAMEKAIFAPMLPGGSTTDEVCTKVQYPFLYANYARGLFADQPELFTHPINTVAYSIRNARSTNFTKLGLAQSGWSIECYAFVPTEAMTAQILVDGCYQPLLCSE